MSNTFNDRVNTAITIVRSEYSGTVFYEAEGTTDDGDYTQDPAELVNMTVWFGYQPNDTEESISITQTDDGAWASPVVHDSPFEEDVEIDWPISMDLDTADEKRIAAGYAGSFSAVTLRRPLNADPLQHPLFIFTVGKDEYVAVDTVTGEVGPFSLSSSDG